MGNSDDDFRGDGGNSSGYRKHHRRSSRRRSNPNVIECNPLRRSSNSGLIDYRSLRRPSAPCVQGGMKPPIPPHGRDARKRSGPMSRPVSQERVYFEGQLQENFDENEANSHSLDSMMLTASIVECPSSIGGPSYSLPFHQHESDGEPGLGISSRICKPSSNSQPDLMLEHRRNRANLQMNQQTKSDNLHSFNDKYRVTSPVEAVQRLTESRSKEQKPEGRIQYERNFLLQLQYEPESLQRPSSLPLLPGIILNEPIIRNDKQVTPSVRKSFNDFSPNFNKSGPGFVIRSPGIGSVTPRMPVMTTGPPRAALRRSGHQKEQLVPRKVIQVSLQQNVQLHTSENAWKPNVHKKDTIEGDQQNEELYRKVRGILNKLTPQKFQTLIQQVHDLEINTEEKLKGCIDLIFEKAISEPSFSVAYANMARCLVSLKVPTEENPNQTITFRKLLLNRCQREFEKDKAEEVNLEQMQALIDKAETEEKKKLLIEEKEQAETKSKKRSLGNIRFIGELYKLKMLTEGIMHDCILRLLRCSHDEDNLECLSRLLTTIGQDIDHEKSKVKVDQYIGQLRKIIETRKISSRIKFMLRDLLELRANGWVPRHEDNKPKMIEQIHKEAEQEEQQRQVLLQRTSQEHKGHRRPHTPSLLSSSVSEEGWRSSSNIVDPSRMKLTKHQVEDIQLGPGGRSGYCTWQRGSSGGGSRTPSLEREKPPRHGSGSGISDNYDYRNYSRSTMPRSKGLAMRSMEKDRSAAIAAVRSMAAGNFGESRTTPSNSRNASRDSSCNRDVTRDLRGSGELPRGSGEIGHRSRDPECRSADLNNYSNDRDHHHLNSDLPHRSCEAGQVTGGAEQKAPERVSLRDIQKKAKSILEEYLQICDLQEATACIEELRSSNALFMFVTETVNFALERSYDERQKLGRLLLHLVKSRRANLDRVISGFREVLGVAEEMEIDIPKIWQYLGELIGTVITDRTVPFRFLRNLCEPLENLEKTSKLIAAVLEVTCETLGKDQVHQKWHESQLVLADFVPPDRLADYIKNLHLEWLQSENVGPSANTCLADLEKLFANPESSNEDVVSWVKVNVGPDAVGQPQFVRALMTAVCRNSIKMHGKDFKVDTDLLKSRCPLLSRYLDHNTNLEVQALNAVQNVVHCLQHPPGVLRTFFDTLYDEDIISEEAFNYWYNHDEVADQQGKGVAKTSVVQFFSWLHEAEDQ